MLPSKIAMQIREIIPQKYYSVLDSFLTTVGDDDTSVYDLEILCGLCHDLLLDEAWKIKMIAIVTKKNEKDIFLSSVLGNEIISIRHDK